ncbi:MAG TPA: hypothetical protein DIS74_08555 [Bacteroidales bacterium]|nr:hypothetical protein [Bacteroidales bacterium]
MTINDSWGYQGNGTPSRSKSTSGPGGAATREESAHVSSLCGKIYAALLMILISAASGASGDSSCGGEGFGGRFRSGVQVEEWRRIIYRYGTAAGA